MDQSSVAMHDDIENRSVSRSLGNFSEVREESGRMKAEKSGHPTYAENWKFVLTNKIQAVITFIGSFPMPSVKLFGLISYRKLYWFVS